MKRVFLAAAVTVVAAFSLVDIGGNAAHAATVKPLPAALSGLTLAKTWTPQMLIAMGPGPNQPGNCTSNRAETFVNKAGYAEVETNGNPGDCADIETQHTYPTVPGYDYEARLYISNFSQWNSFWAYGNNWPTDGEIDSFEGGPGVSSLTYHGPGNVTIGPDPWDNKIIKAQSADIQPGWNTVDIAFGHDSISVYYNGHLYATVSGSQVLDNGSVHDPYWITFGTGSCNSGSNGNVCNSVKTPDPGNMQIAWMRAFK